MIEAGLASLERVAQDGVRVRAAAGAASFRRRRGCWSLPARGGPVRAAPRRAGGRPGGGQPAAGGGARAGGPRAQERVAAALAAPDRLQTKGTGNARASTTDADARVMKMADGGFRPAYNLQFASDTESG